MSEGEGLPVVWARFKEPTKARRATPRNPPVLIVLAMRMERGELRSVNTSDYPRVLCSRECFILGTFDARTAHSRDYTAETDATKIEERPVDRRSRQKYV